MIIPVSVWFAFSQLLILPRFFRCVVVVVVVVLSHTLLGNLFSINELWEFSCS